jgi:hypothetical protein
MESVNISLKLLNEVLGYLGTRPYQESVGLINAIQAEFQKQAAAPKEEPTE